MNTKTFERVAIFVDNLEQKQTVAKYLSNLTGYQNVTDKTIYPDGTTVFLYLDDNLPCVNGCSKSADLIKGFKIINYSEFTKLIGFDNSEDLSLAISLAQV